MEKSEVIKECNWLLTKYSNPLSWKAKKFKFDGSAFKKSFKMDIALDLTLLFELITPHLLWEIVESAASLKVYYMNLLPLLLLIQSSLTTDEELSIRGEGYRSTWSLPTEEELITSDNVQLELIVEQREIEEVRKIESSSCSRVISCIYLIFRNEINQDMERRLAPWRNYSINKLVFMLKDVISMECTNVWFMDRQSGI